MDSAPRCSTCRQGIRWVSVNAGYEHLQPSACPNSEADFDQTQKPEELLAAARSSIETADRQIAAHLTGQPTDLGLALLALASALDSVAFLECWDQPPYRDGYSVWHHMAQRWARNVSPADGAA